MSAEGDKITHCIKGGVAKVRQQGLFLCDTGGELVGQKFIYWIGEYCLV